MPELERALRSLAAAVEWPPTPELVLREPAPAAAPSRRRVLLAAAALVAAVGVAFAVPPARSAILHFLGLGGVRVERVETLPPAAERPLAASLGRRVSAAEARDLLGAPPRLPPGLRRPRLYASGPVVSTLLDTSFGELLLSELRVTPGAVLLKKVAAGATLVEPVAVHAPGDGLWLAGPQHVVLGPAAPPRLAGHVLVWERDGVTYRLEGRTLARGRALALARAISGS